MALTRFLGHKKNKINNKSWTNRLVIGKCPADKFRCCSDRAAQWQTVYLFLAKTKLIQVNKNDIVEFKSNKSHFHATELEN